MAARTPESRSQACTDVAGVRSAFYRLFSVAFRYPTPEVMTELKSRDRSLALLDLMGDTYSVMPGTGRTIALFKESIEACADAADLRVEYARLFIGPFHIPSPPYESVYREGSGGRLMGETTLDVRRAYREESLEVSDTVSDLPDHIIAEMEFMSHLCETEASSWSSDGAEAEKYLGKQSSFLSEHLAKWIPEFSRKVSSSTREEFYRVLATLTHDFISLDRDYVTMLVGAGELRGRW